MVERLVIIGVGLIGGSLALALRQNDPQRKHYGRIIGLGRDARHLQQAADLGVIDHYTDDWAEAIGGADMILLAVPLGAYTGIFASIQDYLAPDTVLTDAGSAKACVLHAAEQVFGFLPAGLVPAHPIAGDEKSGVTAARGDLFRQRRVILTPHTGSAAHAVEAVEHLWRTAGAQVETMSVEHHDKVLAVTSHLPHMLAFGLVDSLAHNREVEEIFRYAAGGFRDFTRIASSDPAMWRDICIYNRAAILQALANYQADLNHLQQAIADADADVLQAIFTRAKAARDKFCG